MLGDLEQLMIDQGIDVFGTADVSKAVPDKFIKLPNAITLGIRLSNAVMDDVRGGPSKNYFHHYRTVNSLLDICALKCVIFLQREGYNALAIPASQTTNETGFAGDFQHKTAANLSGLGFVGKKRPFRNKGIRAKGQVRDSFDDQPQTFRERDEAASMRRLRPVRSRVSLRRDKRQCLDERFNKRRPDRRGALLTSHEG